MTREEFLISLYKYANKPYIWGQSGPLYYDCSGVQFNVLASDLKIGPYQRLTAQGYYDYFMANGIQVLPGLSDLGDFAFFGPNRDEIHHMALCLDKQFMFEAAHGGPGVINEIIAKKNGAKVMVNPITRLPDLFAILRPNSLSFG